MNTLLNFVILVFCVMLIYKCNSMPVIGAFNVNLLGPGENFLLPTDDVYQRLIDLKNFTFLENPQVCKDLNLLLVVLVHSKWSNNHKRMTIRETWDRHIKWNWTRVLFLIGEPEPINMTALHDIREESEGYGDIVMGNFIDTYRNLTYKHVMGLKWVSHHCPKAKYVLKLDDDVEVKPDLLREFMVQRLSPWGARRLIACYYGIWKSPTEYSTDYCLGWVILYSQDAVQALLKTAQAIPFHWRDDVHITKTCANRVGILRTSLKFLERSWAQVFKDTTQGRNRIIRPLYSTELQIFSLLHKKLGLPSRY